MTSSSSFSNLITIKLNEDEQGSSDTPKEISVPLNSTFYAIFDKYEEENNIQHNSLKYIYRGRIIRGVETPSSLKMKDGAQINVVNSNSSYTNKINKSVKIILTLVDPEGIEHQSEIKIDRKIKDWLKNRCSSLNLNFESLSFFLNDKIIDIDKTPHQLKLTSNDKIYAHNKVNISNVDAICHDVQTKVYSPPTNTTPLTKPSSETFITINIKTPDNKTIKAQVDPNETFKHSFKSFLKHHNFNVANYFLLFGKSYINGKDTPSRLQMKEGDVIKLKKKEGHSHHEEDHQKSTESKDSFSSCLLI